MSEETKTNTEQTARRATEGEAPRRGGDRPERGERGGDRPERGGDRRRGGGGRGKFQRRRKFCKFCADTSMQIDHKNPDLLGQFITERCKILPSRVTGTCSKHQRQLTSAIKRARVLALLAFTPLHHD